ncbi:MAG: hypothetical protein JNK79_07140 [Chitinophagaceae bacterium]|nr:hypothetical protein [Chitinophagaceae bacterium]
MNNLKRLLSIAEVLVIIVIALIPLFPNLPYRLNSYLSWEGAYRMVNGQVPFRDFGMPVGYMYWVIPAAFFKIFGAQMITLVKAQVLINILGALCFRWIMIRLNIPAAVRFTGIIVYCLTYSLPNYWPWYNNTVIFYEFVALAFLVHFLTGKQSKWGIIWPALAGAFVFFSFFTKQDGGGLALLVCLALLVYDALIEKRWKPLAFFTGGLLLTGLLIILPLTKYSFGYWFNHGQPPHSSRISVSDIVTEFLLQSQWLKFYLALIIILLFAYIKNFKAFLQNKQLMLFTLLTLGIIAEAAIFQVTSYLPVDNNIFYHSFAIVYILYLLANLLPININSWKTTAVITGCILLIWSQAYWKYIERFVIPSTPETYSTHTHAGYTYADVVNRNTYMIEIDTTAVPLHEWRLSSLPSLRKVLLPGPTVDGIDRLMNSPLVKSGKKLKVLNMSELTTLAAEIPFELEAGKDYPLWFHKGVGMFEKETNMFIDRVKNNYYDLVLFEYVPYSNNIYPFSVREALLENYNRVDTFPVPRNPSSHAWIEVYVQKK